MTEAAGAAPPPKRLPPGRHGLSRELVRESQRRRLMAAAAESLAEHGYGAVTVTGVASAAAVSTATLYQRFDGLWGCLLAAYEGGAERLREEIEAACAAPRREAEDGAASAIAAALAMLAAEPALAHLLSAEPPSQATDLRAARLTLIGRLAALLRAARGRPDGGDNGREARLVGAALALISTQVRSTGAGRLSDLAPTLTQVLLAR